MKNKIQKVLLLNKKVINKGIRILDKIVRKNPLLVIGLFIILFSSSIIRYEKLNLDICTLKNLGVFLILLVGILSLERVIFKKNKNLKSADKNFIVPITSRLFVILGYIAYFAETNRNYYKYTSNLIEKYFGLKIKNFLLGLYLLYAGMPKVFNAIMWPLSFYIYLHGIARNRENFYYFTRYHFAQVYLLTVCGRFINKIFGFLMKDSKPSLFTEVPSLVVYTIFVSLVMFGLISAFLGIESTLPLFHKAVVLYVGYKEYSAPL